jgi:hypothetical protein
MELVEDGYVDFREYNNRIQNADVSMVLTNTENCNLKIACRDVQVIENYCFKDAQKIDKPKYYLVYKFLDRETKNRGVYEATITVKFRDNGDKLILPILDKLFINVL